MKKIFYTIVFLALIALLTWLWPKSRPVSREASLQKTNVQSAVINQTTPSVPSTPTQLNVDKSSPEQVSNLLSEIDKRKKTMAAQAANEWRTPIEFYGRVIDESNNVVSGVMVDYSCNDTSPTGTSYYHTQSDANGFFSFRGIQGKLLQVNVSKGGYYPFDPHGQYFNYAGENQNFVPDAGNPVVFRLRKKGEGAELIKSDFPAFAHIAQLKHDGTPAELDLLHGTTGTGQLELKFQRNLFEKNPKLFNWKLQLTMTGGGFVGTDEEFPFTAPETNYQSVLMFNMLTNNLDWQSEIHTNYYLQLPDGKYGRMSFEFLPWNGVFTIHSLINPSGARNLEPLQ